MKKQELERKVKSHNDSVKHALELVLDCITAKGQRKKLIQNEELKAILDFYGIEITE